MPKNRNQRENDANSWNEEQNQDWYEEYERELESNKENWRQQVTSWKEERSQWNSENQKIWERQNRNNRIIKDRVTGNFLPTLKILGGIILGIFILSGVITGIRSSFLQNEPIVLDKSSTIKPSSKPVSPVPPVSPTTMHYGSPKAQCGDPTPSASDYPLLMYPVLVRYSGVTLRIIRSHYCLDANHQGNDIDIRVASFQSLDDAKAFAEEMRDKFGSAEVGKPVWIESAGKVARFPLEACGDPPISGGQVLAQYYRVHIKYSQKGLLDRIHSEYCKDAQEEIDSGSESHIKMATFYSKDSASKFIEFITSRLGVDGYIFTIEPPNNAVNVSHASLLKQCSKSDLNDSLTGRYRIRWIYGSESYEAALSISGDKGSIKIEFPDTQGFNPSVQQTIALKSCDFDGIAILGSNPIDIKSQKFSTYFPDHFFVKVLANGSKEITVCAEGFCVAGNSFTPY